ncbi:SHNi-TPR protein [Ceratobasidium sp. AG-Ba]|nr:SHNi-TPR protein [Ceratobasidium sp. AG-Ba]
MSAEEAVLKDESTPPTEEPTIESEIEVAKRAFALRNFEEAVDHYATALELYRAEKDEDTAEFAELLLLYGRALLENAISQNAVLGKDKEGEDQKDKAANGAGPSGNSDKPTSDRIHFGGDPESDHEGDTTADLTGEADETKNDDDDAEENDEDEPEDDFNAAWDVLDMARAFYDKQEGDDMKLKLAQTYMYLGDVSLETEKFEQAVSDYTSGLTIKTQLLPFYSRQVCEAHYRLSLVLDLTPGKVSEGVRHIEQAIESLKARVTVLKERLESPADVKGKGKGVYMNDPLEGMDEGGLKSELTEVEELLKDLTLKLEDMKVAPEVQAGESSGADKALDELLQFKPTLPPPELPPIMDGPVNDLTKLVKKKKKPAPAAQPETSATTPVEVDTSTSKGKRKVEAEEVENESSPRDKKAKLEAA